MQSYPLFYIYKNFRSVFNCKKTVARNNYSEDYNCVNCIDTCFYDTDHKHITTGDLNFIEIKYVKNLMSYGITFRLNTLLDYEQVVKRFVNSFILSTSYAYNTPIQAFNKWRFECIKFFKDFLDTNLNSNLYK